MRHWTFTWKMLKSHLKPKKQHNREIQSHQQSPLERQGDTIVKASFWEGKPIPTATKKKPAELPQWLSRPRGSGRWGVPAALALLHSPNTNLGRNTSVSRRSTEDQSTRTAAPQKSKAKVRIPSMRLGLLGRFLQTPGKQSVLWQCPCSSCTRAVCVLGDPVVFKMSQCGAGLLRASSPLQPRIPCGLDQQGEALASLSSRLVYRNRCCRGSSRNDSPKTRGEKTICLFFQGRIFL